jgi:YceI-like domain
VLDPHTVAYLDFGGSHAETLAHLRENGRITLMWCAFTGPPAVVRIHGHGEPVFRDDPRWPELIGRFGDPDAPGVRAIIRVAAERISDTCGFAVPFMDSRGERNLHPGLLRAQDRRAVRRVLRVQTPQRGQHRRTPGAAAATSGPQQLTARQGSVIRNVQRDEHLGGNDFLAMQEYPQITFSSTGVRPVDDTTFEVTGDLTIKGVTNPITIPFAFEGAAKDPFGNLRAGFEGSVTINRKDYGITWNAALETGGVLVSDKVTLGFEVSAIKNARRVSPSPRRPRLRPATSAWRAASAGSQLPSPGRRTSRRPGALVRSSTPGGSQPR